MADDHIRRLSGEDRPPRVARAPNARLFVAPLVDLVMRWEVTEGELLRGFGLTRESTTRSTMHVDTRVFRDVVVFAHRLSGEDGLAVFMGLQLALSSRASLEFAAISATTIGEAITVLSRQASAEHGLVSVDLRVDGDEASITLHEATTLVNARSFVVIATTVCLSRALQALAGNDLLLRSDYTFAEPPFYRRLRHLVPATARFAAASNRLAFPTALLDRQLALPDRAVHVGDERELATLAQVSRKVRAVRRLLPRDSEGLRSVGEVARLMSLTPQALIRLLASQGVRFGDIVDAYREDTALRLISDRTLSAESIAHELGYNDVAAFNRAFRRWTGTTPGRFRDKAMR